MRTGSDLSEGKVAAMDLVVAVHVPKHKHQPIPGPWLLNHCSMSKRIKNSIKIQSNFKLKLPEFVTLRIKVIVPCLTEF